MNDPATADCRRLRFFEALWFCTKIAALLAVIAAVAFCSGCETLDELKVLGHESRSSTTEQTEHAEGAQASSDSAPSAPSAVLLFRYGGFDGSRAAEDPATQIKGFRFSSSGMSYAWAKGDLGAWGLERSDAGAIAAAFYWDEKESAWIGGKFDWISTSRTTRSWENIKGRYNGWDPDAFFAAKKHAFCIVSKDGKKRTNLVTD